MGYKTTSLQPSISTAPADSPDMSAEQYIEQDPQQAQGDNELPTYDDLANQNGPNSRFGRWRGWIEKRAAERYADITPEERERRRERGWDLRHPQPAATDRVHHEAGPIVPPPRAESLPLHIQTDYLSINDSPPHTADDTSTITPPLPFVSQTIAPTHLKINHFGSRFLPHTTTQIRCVLPLLGNKMLLVGHDEGLSVLDMFPQEWSEHGEIITTGPHEATCRPIWLGETIFQMSILETEDIGNGTPQGVVLAVVGPSHHTVSGKEQESIRAARMYSLSSLISLARWTLANKGSKPLDLHKLATWQTQQNTPSKRHRAQGSLARGIKSLIEAPQSHSVQPDTTSPPQSQAYLSPTSSTSTSIPSPSNRGSPSLRRKSDESSWNMVDDLPLRWATDFVPLAVPGSRLVGATVVTFATWSDDTRKGRAGGQLLAIATKSNVLLYETPKGERAYRFVKEFYTPIQPRQLAFIQQTVTDVRGPTEIPPAGRFHSHKRSDSDSTIKGVANTVSSSTPLTYGTHLSLFVIFDKKAGLIRLADSAVGEVELGEDGGPQPSGSIFPRDTFASTISTSSIRQRARVSFDIRESMSKWLMPIRIELPILNQPGLSRPVHILTKGKRTHIVPCPLPPRLAASAPLHAVFWKSNPKHVSPRLIYSDGDQIDEPPLLQLIAFGEAGIEIQEVGISFMMNNGKGRAFPDEQVRGEEDIGETGFLAMGGNWDRIEQIYGSGTIPSASSVISLDSMDSTNLLGQMGREQGIYGWCRKGLTDWRVFWVGGSQESTMDSASDIYYSGDI